MKLFSNLIVTGTIVFVVFLVRPSSAEISISYPLDSVQVTTDKLSIVGTCDEQGSVTVDVKGGSSSAGNQIPIVLGGFHIPLRLSSGMATVTVTSPSGKRAEIRLAYDTKVPGFRKWILHSYEEGFSRCADCHRISETQTNYKRMSVGTGSCTTGKCHTSLGADTAFVHGPVAGGVCISCHNPHGALHQASLTRVGAEQCLVCHESEQEQFKKSHPHTPVAKGECTGCHDPHQSNHQYQLRAEGQELCFLCHDRTQKIGGKVMHGPVGSGECDACHDPHATSFPDQLMAEKNDVCYTCHEQKAEEMKQRFPHPPSEESCLSCHDAHSASERSLLVRGMPALCYPCHKQLEETVTRASIPHPPVASGNCTACHSPHASNEPVMMRKETVQLCGSCHAATGEKLKTLPNRHGPVSENDCGACHTTHGGNQPSLLVEYFPPEFYNPYRENLYSLCFQCHNADIARDSETTTLTGFRDGTRNLHYLHINKRKGRSCKACHDVHASDQNVHVRRSVPFGDLYEYPITFSRAGDGGSCVVGCHKPKKYSRTKRSG